MLKWVEIEPLVRKPLRTATNPTPEATPNSMAQRSATRKQVMSGWRTFFTSAGIAAPPKKPSTMLASM
eukprot:64135-Prorocentrum_minimum.AAC.1